MIIRLPAVLHFPWTGAADAKAVFKTHSIQRSRFERQFYVKFDSENAMKPPELVCATAGLAVIWLFLAYIDTILFGYENRECTPLNGNVPK